MSPMKSILSEILFMAGIFTTLILGVSGLLLAIYVCKRMRRWLKTNLKDVRGEQVIAALMMIGLVILFMFYGPIIMF